MSTEWERAPHKTLKVSGEVEAAAQGKGLTALHNAKDNCTTTTTCETQRGRMGINAATNTCFLCIPLYIPPQAGSGQVTKTTTRLRDRVL